MLYIPGSLELYLIEFDYQQSVRGAQSRYREQLDTIRSEYELDYRASQETLLKKRRQEAVAWLQAVKEG